MATGTSALARIQIPAPRLEEHELVAALRFVDHELAGYERIGVTPSNRAVLLAMKAHLHMEQAWRLHDKGTMVWHDARNALSDIQNTDDLMRTRYWFECFGDSNAVDQVDRHVARMITEEMMKPQSCPDWMTNDITKHNDVSTATSSGSSDSSSGSSSCTRWIMPPSCISRVIMQHLQLSELLAFAQCNRALYADSLHATAWLYVVRRVTTKQLMEGSHPPPHILQTVRHVVVLAPSEHRFRLVLQEEVYAALSTPNLIELNLVGQNRTIPLQALEETCHTLHARRLEFRRVILPQRALRIQTIAPLFSSEPAGNPFFFVEG